MKEIAQKLNKNKNKINFENLSYAW